MPFKGHYADLYDEFYFDKDYFAEASFVSSLYSKLIPIHPLNSILDLGCGSGKHLNELRKLYSDEVALVGVEQSDNLSNRATTLLGSRAQIFTCDLKSFVSIKKFDLIISLFHVSAYQFEANSLLAFFRCISENLKPRGVAIIDFWNRMAWINDPPVSRHKALQKDDWILERTSSPEVDFLAGTLKLHIKVNRIQFDSREILIEETHFLRALTTFEIELAANASGLVVEQFGPWMQLNRPLGLDDWYGYCILTKLER